MRGTKRHTCVQVVRVGTCTCTEDSKKFEEKEKKPIACKILLVGYGSCFIKEFFPDMLLLHQTKPLILIVPHILKINEKFGVFRANYQNCEQRSIT